MQQNGTRTLTSRDTGMLDAFILGHNFTKNVRPPTIGEENDVADERSSQSSVSEKSEVSTATPRRNGVDLGFEPEGTASPLPPYEKWKKSMISLLHDSEGCLAFKNFLCGINRATILDCWLAMKGFQDFDRPRSSGNSSAASSTTGSLSNNQATEERSAKKLKLAKLIYKTYLTANSKKSINFIKAATKQYIMRQIKAAVENPSSSELDSHLFVQAQNEIEHNVEATLYKQFLASDAFSKLSTQQDGSALKISSALNQQSSANQPPKTAQPSSDDAPITGSQIPYLPRLDENQVWNPLRKKRESANQAVSGIPHSSDPLTNPSNSRSGTSLYSSFSRNNEISDAFPYFTEGAPAYWVPPASAIGSDQASKSSDATSDTLSFTDNSSVDGVAYSSSRQGQKRLMRNHIKKNPTNALPECSHVQRTSRMKDIPNLSTKDPLAFFKLLEERLLQVVDEQGMKQKSVGAQFRTRRIRPQTPPTISDPMAAIKNEVEEDLDEMLESHLNRVIESPGDRHSPIMKNRRSQPVGMFQPPGGQGRIGVVPGIAQNEVPEVATPVIPVNKTQMISAWIQTPNSQQTRFKKKSRSGPVVETPSSGHYLHPAESTGLQSGANTRKMQLLLQDQNMPLFDQPDAMTTIEEVKRRLMEETDDSCNYPDFKALNINAISTVPPQSTSTNPPLSGTTVPVPQDHVTDSDSSSETATLSNVNPSGEGAKSEPDSTIVIYTMLHETVPYKVTIPHHPLTLGQFKLAISRKGNYRYYFRQFSEELKRFVFFEVSNDNEILPRVDGHVRAKVDFVSA